MGRTWGGVEPGSHLGGWGRGSQPAQEKENAWHDARLKKQTAENDGMGPYGRPAEMGMPPEYPLWHGKAGQPTGVEWLPDEGRFSDGYVPGPGDKPQF